MEEEDVCEECLSRALGLQPMDRDSSIHITVQHALVDSSEVPAGTPA